MLGDSILALRVQLCLQQWLHLREGILEEIDKWPGQLDPSISRHHFSDRCLELCPQLGFTLRLRESAALTELLFINHPKELLGLRSTCYLSKQMSPIWMAAEQRFLT